MGERRHTLEEGEEVGEGEGEGEGAESKRWTSYIVSKPTSLVVPSESTTWSSFLI